MGLNFKHIDFAKMRKDRSDETEYNKLKEAVKYIFADYRKDNPSKKIDSLISLAYVKINEKIEKKKISIKVPVGWVITTLRFLKQQEISKLQRTINREVSLSDETQGNLESNLGNKPKNKKGEISEELKILDDQDFAKLIYYAAYNYDFRPFSKQYQQIVFDTVMINVLTLLNVSNKDFNKLIWSHIMITQYLLDIKQLDETSNFQEFRKHFEKIGFSYDILSHDLLFSVRDYCINKITCILAKKDRKEKIKMYRRTMVHCENKHKKFCDKLRKIDKMPEVMKEMKDREDFDLDKWNRLIDPNDPNNLLFYDNYEAFVKHLIELGYTKESALKSIKKPPKCDYASTRKKVNKEKDVKKEKEVLEDGKLLYKQIKKIDDPEERLASTEALTNILEFQNISVFQKK